MSNRGIVRAFFFLFSRDSLRRAGVVALIGGVLLALMPAVPASALTPGVAFSSTASSTWQVNSTGIVWALGASHGKVIAGGTFTQLIPPSGGTGTPVNVNGLAILDAETGAPDSCQLPLGSATQTVRAITVSPDGNTVYVAGEFGSVGGIGRSRVAAIDVVNCKVLPFVSAVPSSTVRALALKNNTLYMGGDFLTVAGQTRQRFAAVNATTGALLRFPANADAPGRAVAVSPDGTKVAIGGDFFNVNSAYSHSIAIVDATTGANIKTYGQSDPSSRATPSPRPSTAVRTAASTSATRAPAAASSTAASPSTGRPATRSGATTAWARPRRCWSTRARCMPRATRTTAAPSAARTPGVQQDGWQDGKRNFFNAETASTGKMLGWAPNANDGIGEGLGPRAMVVATGATTGKDYLWYGGEFTKINNATQQGLTRFGPDDLTKPPNVTQVAAQADLRGRDPAALALGGRHRRQRADLQRLPRRQQHPDLDRRRELGVVEAPAADLRRQHRQPRRVALLPDPGDRRHQPQPRPLDRRLGDGTGARSQLLLDRARRQPQDLLGLHRRGHLAAGGGCQHDRHPTPGRRSCVGPTASSDSPVADGSGSMSFNGSSAYAWNDEYASGPGDLHHRVLDQDDHAPAAVRSSATATAGRAPTPARPSSVTSTTGMLYMESGGRVDFASDSAGTAPAAASPRCRHPLRSTTAKWHQVVGSQGPNGMSLYVDGKLVASNQISGNWSYLGVWHVGGDKLDRGGPTDRPATTSRA